MKAHTRDFVGGEESEYMTDGIRRSKSRRSVQPPPEAWEIAMYEALPPDPLVIACLICETHACRNGGRGLPVPCRLLDMIPQDAQKNRDGCRPRVDTAADICAVLRERSMTMAEILAALRMSYGRVKNVIHQMHKAGTIYSTNAPSKRGVPPKIWHLTEGE